MTSPRPPQLTRLGAGTEDEPRCRRRRLAHVLGTKGRGETRDDLATGRHDLAKGCHDLVIAPAHGQRLGFLFAVVVALTLAACGDDVASPEQPPAAPAAARNAADPAAGEATDLDGAAPVLGEGLLAEVSGDLATARAAYERLRAADNVPPRLAALGALHLARLEVRDGKTHRALDLAARAAGLAPNDVEIAEGIAQLQADVVAASGAGDLRGPRLGTPLPGVEPRVAAAFAAAERALGQVHGLRPQPRIEALSSSIELAEDATEDVVTKYHAVALAGGLAQVASDYRIGSLYHDLALGLLFEPPPELDPAAAAAWRRTLRAQAQTYLKRAVPSYHAALGGVQTPDTELWRLAAETDLRAAQDELGEKQ
jgi:hypothetical protein